MLCQVTVKYNDKFWMQHPQLMKAQFLFIAAFCVQTVVLITW